MSKENKNGGRLRVFIPTNFFLLRCQTNKQLENCILPSYFPLENIIIRLSEIKIS